MNAGTSEAEKLYIIQGCREGIRADGRGILYVLCDRRFYIYLVLTTYFFLSWLQLLIAK